jgi:hypothetical protein
MASNNRSGRRRPACSMGLMWHKGGVSVARPKRQPREDGILRAGPPGRLLPGASKWTEENTSRYPLPGRRCRCRWPILRVFERRRPHCYGQPRAQHQQGNNLQNGCCTDDTRPGPTQVPKQSRSASGVNRRATANAHPDIGSTNLGRAFLALPFQIHQCNRLPGESWPFTASNPPCRSTIHSLPASRAATAWQCGSNPSAASVCAALARARSARDAPFSASMSPGRPPGYLQQNHIPPQKVPFSSV